MPTPNQGPESWPWLDPHQPTSHGEVPSQLAESGSKGRVTSSCDVRCLGGISNWLVRTTPNQLRPFARHLVGKMVILKSHECSSRYAQRISKMCSKLSIGFFWGGGLSSKHTLFEVHGWIFFTDHSFREAGSRLQQRRRRLLIGEDHDVGHL